ncbi:hypothetical protein [Methanoregula sp.]|uniref:hypothetical protein n=1 Tax=Methanoregula sp. TaxID=2052170 RepID=UPI003BB0406E
MPYNWYNYLVFARNLNNNPVFIASVCDDETIKRNCVSRAYYAAFHHAKNYAETQGGFKFPEDDVHAAVKRWFKQNKKFNVWNDLRELSTWRNDCDYKDEVSNLDTLTIKSLKGAERVHHYF